MGMNVIVSRVQRQFISSFFIASLAGQPVASTISSVGASTPLYDKISEAEQCESRDLRLTKRRVYQGSSDKTQIRSTSTVFVTAAAGCDVIICRPTSVRPCSVLTAGGNYFNLEVRYSMLFLLV